MRLKLCDSHLICKVANKCLNVRERVQVVEWNKKWSPPFPCCPVSRQCPWKKTLMEKKEKNTEDWEIEFQIRLRTHQQSLGELTISLMGFFKSKRPYRAKNMQLIKTYVIAAFFIYRNVLAQLSTFNTNTKHLKRIFLK